MKIRMLYLAVALCLLFIVGCKTTSRCSPPCPPAVVGAPPCAPGAPCANGVVPPPPPLVPR